MIQKLRLQVKVILSSTFLLIMFVVIFFNFDIVKSYLRELNIVKETSKSEKETDKSEPTFKINAKLVPITPAIPHTPVVLTPEEKATGIIVERTDPYATIVEEMPMFVGGRNALNQYFENNLVLTKEIIRNGKSQSVEIGFIVNYKGALHEIYDASSYHYHPSDYNKAIKRIVESMPKWIPGKEKGKAVIVRCMLEVELEIIDR